VYHIAAIHRNGCHPPEWTEGRQDWCVIHRFKAFKRIERNIACVYLIAVITRMDRGASGLVHYTQLQSIREE